MMFNKLLVSVAVAAVALCATPAVVAHGPGAINYGNPYYYGAGPWSGWGNAPWNRGWGDGRGSGRGSGTGTGTGEGGFSMNFSGKGHGNMDGNSNWDGSGYGGNNYYGGPRGYGPPPGGYGYGGQPAPLPPGAPQQAPAQQ